MEEREITEAYRATFAGIQGGQVMEDLMYQFYEPVGYSPGQSAAEDAVFFAGQRYVVAYIKQQLLSAEYLDQAKE